jgi:NADPH2:quinone reductase
VGYQAAGTVVEAGSEQREFAVGDRVCTTGGFGSHAELRAVAARTAWKIPDSLSTREAAVIPVTFGTADDCLFEFGHLQAGETVLIQAGAGGVGLAAIQLAKRAGATVLATASSDERLARLPEFGMDTGIDYSERDWVDRVRAATGGEGVDLAVDSVGGRILFGSIRCLAYRGRAITVGNAGRDPQPVDVSVLAMGNQSITGVFLGAELGNAIDRTWSMIARHIEDVATGQLRVVIDRTFPLAEAAAAHAYIESRQAVGRVVLMP